MGKATQFMGAVTILLVASACALAAACSSRGSTERVGSSAAPITVSSIKNFDSGVTIPSNASTAVGEATLNGQMHQEEQLTVWQGKFGSATENGFAQRTASGLTMNISGGNAEWGGGSSLNLADNTTLAGYDGPVKVVYLDQPNKFLVASVASSNKPNTDVDVVLISTTDGGTTTTGWTRISALNHFYAHPLDTTISFPLGTYNYQVESLQLAVDPFSNPSSSEGDHDVWLYFTTTNGNPNSRTVYFIEFWVLDNGTFQQVFNTSLSGTNNWATMYNGMCPFGFYDCGTIADTFTMVAGKQKTCSGMSGWGQNYILGAWASVNPRDSGACPHSGTHSTTWSATSIIGPDGTSPTTYPINMSGIGPYNEPDCIGSQVNWPAAALASDLTNTTGPGGGGSSRIALSGPVSSVGQGIFVWDMTPIGCSGVGSTCTYCCNVVNCPGSTGSGTPGSSTGGTCTKGGNPDFGPIDCNDTGCNTACKADPWGSDQIEPALAYNLNMQLTLAWYDSRDGSGSPKTFGGIWGQSSSTEFAANLGTAVSILQFDSEGSATAKKNLSIGLASTNEDTTHFFGASHGGSTLYDWTYTN